VIVDRPATVANIYTSSSRIYYIHRREHITSLLHFTLAIKPGDSSILRSEQGPLHLGIRQSPLELLGRVPVVEDRPATVGSNLKNGSIYIYE
jgi:hypothetical protein